MVMEVKPEQSPKHSTPKLVTDSGIIVLLHPAIMIFLSVRIIALQLSLESYTGLFSSTFIVSNAIQPEKQPLPKLVTELGMVMEVNLEQP